MTSILTILLLILISYPILGSMSWVIGSVIYKVNYKSKHKNWDTDVTYKEPFISILVAAHNEEDVIEKTLDYLLQDLTYKSFEILVVDDGSTDATLSILMRRAEKFDKLRIIHIEKNQGKAHALNIGLGFAKGKYVVTNDADTIPSTDALNRYASYLKSDFANYICAVTANMDVQNRTKIITKSQTVEFSSIVGIIKRTQSAVMGGIYAYSGANTLYSMEALIDVGLFRQDRATEDISVAWDHQINGWFSIFAPAITFFMQVPENLPDLYKQRKRWAKGGTEVWLTNGLKVARRPFKNIGLSIMFLDQTLSIIWSFFFFTSLIYFVTICFHFLIIDDWGSLFKTLTVSMIFCVFEFTAGLMQVLAALVIDHDGDKIKYFLFSPLYLIFYWIMNALTIVTTFVPAVKTILGYGTGVWTSPKRKVIK